MILDLYTSYLSILREPFSPDSTNVWQYLYNPSTKYHLVLDAGCCGFLGGTSSSPQISSLELIAKSAPYKDLRNGTELLSFQITQVRENLDLLDRPLESSISDELISRTHRTFKEAYRSTYIYKIHCFYEAQRFEQEDCSFFDEAIICIKKELVKSEPTIRELKKSDPNITTAKESLGNVITEADEIVMFINQRLVKMGVSTD